MDVATLGILGCAVLITLVVFRREFLAPASSERERRIAVDEAVTHVGQVIGDRAAPVPVVVFSDFQCPYCARAQAVLDSVRARHASSVQIVYRHLPLETLHPHAWTAAVAAECAGIQDRFASFHDVLFDVQDSIGIISWDEFARRAGGIEPRSFADCVAREQPTGAVERDVLLARTLHLRGTPTFIVDGDLLEGVPSVEWFDVRVARSLRRRD